MSHFTKSGKLNQHTLKDITYSQMKGSTPLEQEVYEQFLILQAKNNGVKLHNVVNPMGGRMSKYNEMFEEVITKYNLPKDVFNQTINIIK